MKASKEAVQIVNYIQDPPFGWMSRYRAVLEEDQIAIRLRINFKSDPGMPLRNILKVRDETEEALQRYFNQRFEMIDQEGLARPLRIYPEFTLETADLAVRLHPGNGRSNLNHWFVESEPIIRAHEIGHALGLPDEYIDLTTQERASSFSPGVYRDHSLMGNFFAEGLDRAELKPRHASFLARTISQAAGLSLSAGMQPRLQGDAPPEPNSPNLVFTAPAPKRRL